MNAMRNNSVNKDSKVKNVLITSVAVSALAIGLSFPIGAMVVGSATDNGSQMGGAPGATTTPAESAVTPVVNVYQTSVATNPNRDNLDAVLKANSSSAYYERYKADAAVLKYDPLLQTQQAPQSIETGKAVVNGDTAYVPVTLYSGYGDQRTVLSNVVVTVDTASNKIIGVAGQYR
jgi:hypothetical protein